MQVELTDDERELLKHLSKDINRTAYHGGIGERAPRYLGLLDKLIGEPGWELRFPSAAEIAKGEADLAEALDRLHRCIVHDARDWSLSKRDALTYALVVGWDGAWGEVAQRHGWTEQEIADLKRLHAAVDVRKREHRKDVP